MILKRIFSYRCFLLASLMLYLVPWQFTAAQEQKIQNNNTITWLIFQTLPSCSWTNFSSQTHFAFEWETTPVLYSFGMNKLDPPWHFFRVTQPERFTGSLELNISIQLYTSKVNTSHWGYSGQLVAHLPLVEYGEYLGFNFGIARYTIAGTSSNYVVGGLSTFFGFLHYNIKYCPADKIWMNSIELRFF